MGGYVGQAYAQLYPDRLAGFISIDSAPLQRNYVTAVEIWHYQHLFCTDNAASHREPQHQ